MATLAAVVALFLFKRKRMDATAPANVAHKRPPQIAQPIKPVRLSTLSGGISTRPAGDLM